MPRIAPISQPDANLSAVLAVLEEIRDRLAKIEKRLEPRRHASDDEAVLRRLLPAIGGHFGSAWFTVSELYADRLFQFLLAGWSAKSTGRLLSRHCASVLDGYTVEGCETTQHSARLWRVLKVVSGETPRPSSKAALGFAITEQ